MEIKILTDIKNLLNPRKSLKALLTIWFLIFSFVPLSFLTGYSLVTFEKVYDDELLKRLNDNFLVITKTFEDLNGYLKSSIELHAGDDELIFNLSTQNIPGLKKLVPELMRGTNLNEFNLFDREGQLIVSFRKEGLTKEEQKVVTNDLQAEKGDIFLNDALLISLTEKERLVLSDINPKSGFDILAYSVVVGRRGKIEGYIQEVIHIDEYFLQGIKKKYNLDLVILDKDYRATGSTVKDFLAAPASHYKKGETEKVKFVDIHTKESNFSILIKPYNEQSSIRVGLASRRTEIETTISKIRDTLGKIVLIVIGVILLVLWFVSVRVLRPLNYLLEAVKKLESGENVSYIPSEGQTEVGILTKSFNEMSRKITKVQSELTHKVQELEKTNKELQETQGQLVHSAKMGSLGQIVAGVAHELNNPIGFIYSNMSILKDYGERLTRVLDVVEKDPKNIHEAKKENDLEYVLEDLPRLIRSCEEGSKRVRDIVMNLKTFSRSDELEKKEYNVIEGIESTLQLLKSEYKDRVSIQKKFQEVPDIQAYAGQLNQVFMNILTNALQAIEGKGEITIQVQKKGLELEIIISDSGKGIPKDIREKIFDPFFTTKPVGQGTGLGLSISYGIIQKHQGRIELDSEIGKGTQFRIYLPIVTPR